MFRCRFGTKPCVFNALQDQDWWPLYSFTIKRHELYLNSPLTKEAYICTLLLLFLFHILRFLFPGPDAAEGQRDVQRRLKARLKVHPVLLLEPAGGEGQAAPRHHPQHVGHHTPVELQAGFLLWAPGDVGQASRGVGILPCPFKLLMKGRRRQRLGLETSIWWGSDTYGVGCN